MSSSVDLTKDIETLPVLGTTDLQLYQALVGTCLYLANSTRFDIAFAVNQLARYMAKPNATHLAAARRVLQYLKATVDQGLTYQLPTEPWKKHQLYVFSDAQLGGDRLDRKSIHGHCMFFNSGTVHAVCKRLKHIVLSSTEAEYAGLALAAQDVMPYLVTLLGDMGFPQTLPVTIYEDNQPTIHIASNPVCGQLARHIDYRYHFIREKVLAKELVVVYCSTENMVADIFTKPLDKIKFRRFRDSLMGSSPPSV